MDNFTDTAARVVLTGAGATAAMDLWLLLLRQLGVPTLNFAFIGRWAGHLARGRLAHESIARAAPVRGETALGWLVHYATGIGFAALLVAVAGTQWLQAPTVVPALLVGIATVLAPFLVLQPALGAGIASSRTPTPGANRLRSLANHAVFGLGLYGAGRAASWLLP